MNLDYEVTGIGYTILLDGKPWIVQDSYIPFPAETLEQSAQLHINSILEEQTRPPVPTIEEELHQTQESLGNLLFESAMDKSRITELENNQGEMLMEIAMLKMGGSL